METANPTTKTPTVALRKESVDRNDVIRPAIDVFLAVALRKESVDRNNGRLRAVQNTKMSLSARRAWIEIMIHQKKINPVALRKESVDRNAAWTGVLRDMHHVALRKESVDRNT